MDTRIEANKIENSETMFEGAAKIFEQILIKKINEYKFQDVFIRADPENGFVLGSSDFSKYLIDTDHEYCMYNLQDVINEFIKTEDNQEYLQKFSRFLRECSYAVERKIHDTH